MGICHAKSQNDHVIEQSVDAAYLSIKHWNWGINTIKVSIIYFYFSALFWGEFIHRNSKLIGRWYSYSVHVIYHLYYNFNNIF